MIRVLIVEDSPVIRESLAHILDSDPEIQIIGTAENGEEAVAFVTSRKPDIVTMDIHMPKMDGFTATRLIMETKPVPIIIVTGSAEMRDMEMSFRAIQAGALTVLLKPRGIGHPDHEREAKELVKTVKLMSEVKVVRRWARTAERKKPPLQEAAVIVPPDGIRIVAIGASTGGPPVIQKILSGLPKDFALPVLIVQHMAKGFTDGFTEWLGQTSRLPVHVAVDNSHLLPGRVYIAPEEVQMKVELNGRLSCVADGPENGLRPSVSYLFRSIAAVFEKHAAGVLLTGMGKDGAEELKLMKDKGAITIAQDEESSVVFGMPGEAVKLDAAQYVLSPEQITAALSSLGEPRQRQPALFERQAISHG